MADNIISESQYRIDKKSLQIAQSFFDIEDVSLLKVGQFGYTTALFSDAVRYGAFHRDMLYNEFFLVSASLNSTLYNWSKTLDADVELATPSRLQVALKVPVEQMENISTDTVSGNKAFTITRDKVFDVGGFNFLLPYDIKIFFSRSANNQLSITATYDFNNVNYADSSITSPQLKVKLSTENNVSYVTIAFTIFQIEKKDWIFTMTSNDILDMGILEQDFGENLVTFNTFYNANSTSLDSFTKLESIFNQIDNPTTDQFCYYTYIGTDKIRLYFSNQPSEFRPAYNSKVKLETFTTTAELGNFDYAGSISVNDDNFDNIDYIISPLSSSATGGASIKSFKNSKIALMEKLRTRDNYTTAYDLTTYFKNVKATKLQSNSDFTVVKLRDDIFRRQFTLYILQRNGSGELVPTNTVDLSMSLEEIAAMDYSIKPGTMVIYDRVTSKYRLLADDELPEIYLSSPDTYLFCVPFLINFDFKEFPKANIYFTNYNKTISLEYSYYNVDNPFEIVINSLNTYRNPLNDIDGFYVACTLNTSSINLSNIIIRGVLYNESGEEVGYADLNRVDSTTEYKLLVKSRDKFDADGKYIVEETFRDIDTGNIIQEVKLNGSYTLKLAVLSTDTPTSGKTAVYNRMPDLTRYGLSCELTPTEKISFADDLTDLMYCQTTLNESTGKIDLSKVPLIGALFYLNTEQNTAIMNDLYENILLARDISRSLENNTTIDIKFFNTSGVSRYWSIDTVDQRIKLAIALNTTVTKNLSNEIKEYVANFIEERNTELEKRFSISNLIKSLETEFSQIKYIKFFSINGANVQNIEQTSYTDTTLESLPMDYVPEYITVRKVLPSSNSENSFEYDIDIEYL